MEESADKDGRTVVDSDGDESARIQSTPSMTIEENIEEKDHDRGEERRF